MNGPTVKKQLAVFAGIGFEIVGLIIAAIWVGGWLDQRFQTKGIATIVLILLAMVGWILHIYYLLRDLNRSGAGRNGT